MKTSAQQGHTWIGKTYQIAGTWAIESEGPDQYFVLGEDFKTNGGPDLKLFLVAKAMDEIDGRESVDEQGLFVGELKSSSGEQRYKLPAGTDLSQYTSMVIHCKAYSVVWGGVDLQ